MLAAPLDEQVARRLLPLGLRLARRQQLAVDCRIGSGGPGDQSGAVIPEQAMSLPVQWAVHAGPQEAQLCKARPRQAKLPSRESSCSSKRTWHQLVERVGNDGSVAGASHGKGPAKAPHVVLRRRRSGVLRGDGCRW